MDNTLAIDLLFDAFSGNTKKFVFKIEVFKNN